MTLSMTSNDLIDDPRSLTSAKHTQYPNTQHDLSLLPRHIIEQRYYELEEMLDEFQESSKELEKALEEELQLEEQKSQQLIETIKFKDQQIYQTKQQNLKLQQDLNEAESNLNSKIKNYEDQLTSLKQSIVSVEICNDDFESNDRVLTNKLELANQFNNDLLEKLAITENDLELERKSNLESKLYITNYQNTIQDLKDQIVTLEEKISKPLINTQENKEEYEEEEEDHDDFNSTVLSMREVLKNGPPNIDEIKLFPRTASAQKDMNAINEKVKNWNANFFLNESFVSDLKADSTTQITNHLHTTKSNDTCHSLKRSNSSATLTTIKSSDLNTEKYSTNSSRSSSSASTSTTTTSIGSQRKGISPSPSMMNISEKIYDTASLHSNTSTKHKKSNHKLSRSYSNSHASESHLYKHTHSQSLGNKLETIEGSPNSSKIKDTKIDMSDKKRGLFSPLKTTV